MPPKSHEERMLAVSLRSRRFGYAVFEGSSRLLDWGILYYPMSNRAQRVAASKRVTSLFTLLAPSMVVVQPVRRQNGGNKSDADSIIRMIKHEASIRTIPVRAMKKAEVKNVFRRFGATSKHEIASGLTEVFPELVWQLPPKRKIWETEHFRMVIFDAVALGFAHWIRYSERDPTAE